MFNLEKIWGGRVLQGCKKYLQENKINNSKVTKITLCLGEIDSNIATDVQFILGHIVLSFTLALA